MKRIVPILIVLGVVGLVVWTGKYLYSKNQPPPEVVETVEPFVADIVKKTVATGSIVPRKEIEIKPRVSGILDELVVEPGVQVKKGDLLARIKIVPDMASLQRAQAQVKSARISFDNARREYDRNQNLFKQKVISETELARFRLDFELAQQELAAAQENLQLVKEGASRAARKAGVATTEVRSTVDGMVLQVPEEEGASVIESNNFNPGTTIAIVADMSDMIFEGLVDESEVGKIKEGMKLDVRIGALQSEQYGASLEYIAPKGVLQEGAIQFEIRAAMALKEGTFIRAGYSATADIVLDRRDQVLALNEAVLQFDKGKPFIEVQTGPGAFERRDVEVGLSDGIKIEVKSGVNEGDAVKKPDPAEGGPGRRGRR